MESWVAGKYGDGIVSLDVAGSYPVAVRVPKGKRALAAIESELSFWPMKLDDELGEIWVNPLNGKDGFFYEPPDPRFYEEEVKQA